MVRGECGESFDPELIPLLIETMNNDPSLSRRAFLKTTGLMGAAGFFGVGGAQAAMARGEGFRLPALPYAPDALQPYIDAETMRIHHGKHHAGYTRKLNAALREGGIPAGDLEGLFLEIPALPVAIREGIRNNGGGYYNHRLFWEVMAPEGATGSVSAALASEIETTFGSMEDFQDTFSNAAGSQFGSGWAWLVVRSDGSLVVTNTPNQDNPLMLGLVPEEEYGTPILGLDVWEHAYYLKYQNRRGEYVQNWWNVVNWDQVSANYTEAVAG